MIFGNIQKMLISQNLNISTDSQQIHYQKLNPNPFKLKTKGFSTAINAYQNLYEDHLIFAGIRTNRVDFEIF